MSKSKEELEVLKKEVEELNEKIRELTPEELEQVNGGTKNPASIYGTQIVKLVEATCQAEIAEK